MHKNAIKIVGGVKFSKKYLKMWDFLSKNCGIFSSKGGTKIWDFRRRGGDFRRSGFGHTGEKLNRPDNNHKHRHLLEKTMKQF